MEYDYVVNQRNPIIQVVYLSLINTAYVVPQLLHVMESNALLTLYILREVLLYIIFYSMGQIVILTTPPTSVAASKVHEASLKELVLQSQSRDRIIDTS